MKLYTGFMIEGEVVRWVPPSIARGRPEGFWTENGYRITCEYQGETYWFGSTEGVFAVYPKYKDQAGRQVFKTFQQVSIPGQQKGVRSEGVGTWMDEWEVIDGEVRSVEVWYGYEDFIADRFTSSYIDYCNTIEDGLYMIRKDARTVQLPLIEDIAEFHMPPKFGTTPY